MSCRQYPYSTSGGYKKCIDQNNRDHTAYLFKIEFSRSATWRRSLMSLTHVGSVQYASSTCHQRTDKFNWPHQEGCTLERTIPVDVLPHLARANCNIRCGSVVQWVYEKTFRPSHELTTYNCMIFNSENTFNRTSCLQTDAMHTKCVFSQYTIKTGINKNMGDSLFHLKKPLATPQEVAHFDKISDSAFPFALGNRGERLLITF